MFRAAICILNKFGFRTTAAVAQLVIRCARESMMNPAMDRDEKRQVSTILNESELQPMSVMRAVRDALYRSSQEVRDPQIERLLVACHLYCLKEQCIKLDCGVQAAKIAISLCRYCDVLPADRCFYEAGLLARTHLPQTPYAFIMWNRFVDIADCIDSAQQSSVADLDNSEFERTDIPLPHSIPLPPVQSYSASVREEARDWVVDQALGRARQGLPMRSCETCSQSTYEASCSCSNCSADSSVCIVSGFPVRSGRDRIQCGGCSRAANREDWNKLVSKSKHCPFCSIAAAPSF